MIIGGVLGAKINLSFVLLRYYSLVGLYIFREGDDPSSASQRALGPVWFAFTIEQVYNSI